MADRKPYHIWEYNTSDFHQMTILMPRLGYGQEEVTGQWKSRKAAELWAHRNCNRIFRVLQCMGGACPVEKRLADWANNPEPEIDMRPERNDKGYEICPQCDEYGLGICLRCLCQNCNECNYSACDCEDCDCLAELAML